MWQALLRQEGCEIHPEMEDRFRAFLALVREWNPVCSLVSRSDEASLETAHLVDSVSLYRYVAEACSGGRIYLDIGSGGGFPAIPLAILLPGVPVVLVERSAKKAGFLHKARARLELTNIEVRCGVFPGAVRDLSGVGVITARAVERPERVLKGIMRYMERDTLFLCQFPGLCRQADDTMFHVEPCRDAWSLRGFRRGELFLLRRLAE